MPAAVSSGGPYDVPEGAQGGALAMLSAEDRGLVERLRSGDERTFLTMVEKNHRAMVRVALGHVSSEAVAEEVVQEAWISVLGGLDTFEGRSSFRTWVLTILVHAALRRGRRESRSAPDSSGSRPR